MSEVTQLISTVGFPIVAYLLMVLQSNRNIEQLENAINNNTIALNQLMSEVKNNGN